MNDDWSRPSHYTPPDGPLGVIFTILGALIVFAPLIGIILYAIMGSGSGSHKDPEQEHYERLIQQDEDMRDYLREQEEQEAQQRAKDAQDDYNDYLEWLQSNQ